MKSRTLIKRSLRYHWRSHLGVVLGAAVATAVLVGALAVGDSVRYSLLASAESRWATSARPSCRPTGSWISAALITHRRD